MGPSRRGGACSVTSGAGPGSQASMQVNGWWWRRRRRGGAGGALPPPQAAKASSSHGAAVQRPTGWMRKKKRGRGVTGSFRHKSSAQALTHQQHGCVATGQHLGAHRAMMSLPSAPWPWVPMMIMSNSPASATLAMVSPARPTLIRGLEIDVVAREVLFHRRQDFCPCSSYYCSPTALAQRSTGARRQRVCTVKAVYSCVPASISLCVVR